MSDLYKVNKKEAFILEQLVPSQTEIVIQNHVNHHPIRRIIVAGAALLGSIGINVKSEHVQAADGIESFQEEPTPGAGSFTEFTIPAGSTSVINMTVTETLAPGYFQILGEGSTIGSSSNQNSSFAGQTVAGMAFAKPATADGKMQVYSQNGGHIVIDRAGSLAEGAFDDVPDVRLLDTRKTGNVVPANSVTEITARPNSTGVVSLTATDVAAPGYIQVLASPNQVPGQYSNLNATPGYTSAKLAFVHFNENGKAWLYNQSKVSEVVDLQGYFNSDAVVDVEDVRILDTRNSGNTVPMGSLTKIHGNPNSTGIVSLVAVGATLPGFIQVVNKGDTLGATSNVNTDPNSIAGNLAFVNFDENGEASLFNSVATHLVVDLQAYLAAGKFIPVKPTERVIDTRVDRVFGVVVLGTSGPSPILSNQLSISCTYKGSVPNESASKSYKFSYSGLAPDLNPDATIVDGADKVRTELTVISGQGAQFRWGISNFADTIGNLTIGPITNSDIMTPAIVEQRFDPIVITKTSASGVISQTLAVATVHCTPFAS